MTAQKLRPVPWSRRFRTSTKWGSIRPAQRAGAHPVKDDLDRISGIRTVKDAAPVVADLHRRRAIRSLRWAFESDLMNSNMNALYVSQSDWAWATATNYLDAENAALREGYVACLTQLFSLAGFDKADERAASVLDFETKMARRSARTCSCATWLRCTTPCRRRSS